MAIIAKRFLHLFRCCHSFIRYCFGVQPVHRLNVRSNERRLVNPLRKHTSVMES